MSSPESVITIAPITSVEGGGDGSSAMEGGGGGAIMVGWGWGHKNCQTIIIIFGAVVACQKNTLQNSKSTTKFEKDLNENILSRRKEHRAGEGGEFSDLAINC